VENQGLPFVLVDDDQTPMPNTIRSKYLTANVDDPGQNIYAQAYVRLPNDLKSDKTPEFRRNIPNDNPILQAQLLAGRGTMTVTGPGYLGCVHADRFPDGGTF
jgi:hypothetical protein